MVTAKTQRNLNNAQSYFAEHLAVGDYYQEGQKVACEWFGAGARSLGLSGKIRESDFLALCENQNPQSGETLTQRTNSVREQDGATTANRRIFYDFTFSPPKSVSLMALVADDKRIIGAHYRAVQIALAEFEPFATPRVRKDKANGSRFTRNVVAGLFTHDTSRALDPHLHGDQPLALDLVAGRMRGLLSHRVGSNRWGHWLRAWSTRTQSMSLRIWQTTKKPPTQDQAYGQQTT